VTAELGSLVFLLGLVLFALAAPWLWRCRAVRDLIWPGDEDDRA
jgi:hypothetical protein